MTALSSCRSADLEAAHKLLFEAVEGLTTSEDWRKFLDSARRFHRYSTNNILLLMAQGAQGAVAGYSTWRKVPATDGGGCQVRRGEKGMAILAPVTRRVDADEPEANRAHTNRAHTNDDRVGPRLVGFRVVKVFDQTQLVNPPDIAERPKPVLLTGDGPRRVWDLLVCHATRAGFEVNVVETSELAPANGQTRWADHTVAIRDDLDGAQRIKTLAHEIGHIGLHDPARTPAGARLGRSIKEVEAESVAYLVGTHVGIDTSAYSLAYIAGWAEGNAELVRHTAQRVVTAARAVTTHLDRHLGIGPDDLTPATALEAEPAASATAQRLSSMAAHTASAGLSRSSMEPSL